MTEPDALRLGPHLLGTQEPPVRWPDYSRDRVRPGIVHLGIGAFHRAHQAVYVDDGLKADPSWGIIGVSLRSTATRDALAPQGNLYTVLTRGPEADSFRVIGSVIETLAAREQPERVVARLADPDTRIVSLTVTEKGYCRDDSGFELDTVHPDIAADLRNPSAPRSMPGTVVAGLALRRDRGLPPFTVLSCDNLPDNGKVARSVLLNYAARIGSSLEGWMENNLRCPSTMVDRIVPATTSNEIARLIEACGFRDALPVVAEPFSQWVMQDDFPLGRPAWTSPGITFVDDVGAHEEMKLRLLNGSHSALAYAGLLAGHETAANAFANEALRRFLTRLAVDELIVSLGTLPVSDPLAYLGRLHERFANPAIRHPLLQIASDGSQKLPQRLLTAARILIRKGRLPCATAVAIAAWIQCWRLAAAGRDGFALSDPLADSLRAAVDGKEPAAAVTSIFALRAIFSKEDQEPLAGLVTEALEVIQARGIAAAAAVDPA